MVNDKKSSFDFEPCLTELLVQLPDEVTDEHFESANAKAVLRQIVRERYWQMYRLDAMFEAASSRRVAFVVFHLGGGEGEA